MNVNIGCEHYMYNMALRSLRALRAPSPHQPLTLRLHLYGGPSGFTVYMLRPKRSVPLPWSLVPLTGLKPPNRTFLDLSSLGLASGGLVPRLNDFPLLR